MSAPFHSEFQVGATHFGWKSFASTYLSPSLQASSRTKSDHSTLGQTGVRPEIASLFPPGWPAREPDGNTHPECSEVEDARWMWAGNALSHKPNDASRGFDEEQSHRQSLPNLNREQCL